jgi:uncharacterized protein (DUF1778 family)
MEQLRNQRIFIRCTPKEKNRLQLKAEINGAESVSQYVLECCGIRGDNAPKRITKKRASKKGASRKKKK